MWISWKRYFFPCNARWEIHTAAVVLFSLNMFLTYFLHLNSYLLTFLLNTISRAQLLCPFLLSLLLWNSKHTISWHRARSRALIACSLVLCGVGHFFLFVFGKKQQSSNNCIPDESRGYFRFSMVIPPQRFPFGLDKLKNILVRPFKFGMWVYMGNATNAIVLWPWPSISRSLVAS